MKIYLKLLIFIAPVYAILLLYLFAESLTLSPDLFSYAAAETALTLLCIVLLLGPLARQFDLFEPTIPFRKPLGITAFLIATCHGMFSLLARRDHVPVGPNIPFIAGTGALGVLLILYLTSWRTVVRVLNKKTWWKLQYRGIRIAVLAAIIHEVALRWRDWAYWSANSQQLPPLSLLVTALAIFTLILRLLEVLDRNVARWLMFLSFVGFNLAVGLMVAPGIHQIPATAPFSRLFKPQPPVLPDVHENETDITNGPAVRLTYSSPPVVGEATSIQFRIYDMPSGYPTALPLDSLLGNPIHAIGVREDLTHFFHIHPKEVIRNYFYDFTRVFDAPGRYALWSWINQNGMTYFIAHPITEVRGEGEPLRKNVDFTPYVRVGNFGATISYKRPLLVNADSVFTLQFVDNLGNAQPLEPYAGSTIHASAIKDDLSIFIHGHEIKPQVLGITDPAFAHEEHPIVDLAHPLGENGLIATQIHFTVPGIYKLFIDFRPKGIDMPPSDSLHAGFYLSVEEQKYQ